MLASIFAAAPCAAQIVADRSLDTVLQFEPLVITAPRLKLKGAPIDPQINLHLLRLLRERQDARPTSQDLLDASVGNLNKLSTLTGYNLKTRYTELGFLLTEGLAGVTDFELSNELEKTVRLGSNVQTRAAAMVALGYTYDSRYLPVFQGSLQNPNTTVRFGAVESLLVLAEKDPGVQLMIGNVARTDVSPVLRIYATAGLWKMGDIHGREILLRFFQDPDWFLRAMAAKYIGDFGGADEYRKLMLQLSQETHPSVKAELASALMRLKRFKD